MKIKKIAGLVLGGICIAALSACNEESSAVEANGVNAAAVTAKVERTAREVCTDKVVTRQKAVKDKDRVLGTVAGALVGGVVGNEVGGKGSSGDVATVAGAAAGGYAGNRVQKSVQQNATETTTERECHTVYE